MPSPAAANRSTTSNSVCDHMTRLRMQMVQQKIANEKERIMNRPPSEESNQDELENQAKLQQAMLRRQELLDKIRREQLMNDEYKRPRTYSARRRYTPSPLPVPPSRRSMPEYDKYHNTYYNPDTRRSPKPGMSQVKHVVEHRLATPKPHNLPPIHNPPQQLPYQQQQQQQQQPTYQQPQPAIQQPPAQPGVIFQSAPAPTIMQQAPPPQIIQAPAPQHIVQQIPHPIIQDLTGGANKDNRGMFNKADFGEMMMMQNAQMHQMVMQKLMIGSLGGGGGMGGSFGGGDSNHGDSNHCHGSCCGRESISVQCMPRPNAGAVHHHHYSTPPQSQPSVHHYTSMPSMEMRGGYPQRDYTSAYTAPMSSNVYEDDNDRNYFVYH